MSMLGTFSAGGLGMGLAFQLKDEFTATAAKINGSMGALEANADRLAARVNRSMKMVTSGFKMALAGAIITAPFVAGVGAASDLEENINKVDVAFGKYVDKVKAFSKISLSEVGIDKIQALDTMALFGDMATGMGMSQEKAAALSINLAKLAGDMSSFKNISADVSTNALKGIFTGIGMSLRNIGIVMTEQTLDAFAISKGITKAYKDMNELERIELRYALVMDRSKNAVGDFVRTSDGYANTKRVFGGAIKEMSATLGNVFMPIATKFLKIFTKIVRAFEAFAQSGVGKVIMKATMYLGIFLTVVGIGKMAVGGFTIAISKMALMFKGATRANILLTLSTKGSIAALRKMAVAAWASLGPYALIVVAIMAVVGVFMYLYKHVGIVNRRTKQFVGVLKGLWAIFSSWDGKTFELTLGMEKMLDELGIKQLVLDLGTWIVRIKEFLFGMRDGFVEAFTVIKNIVTGVWGTVKAVFKPFIDLLYDWNILVRKNTSSIDKWRNAGKIFAYIIVATVVPALISMAVAMVAATWPVLLVIAIIVGLIYVFRNWGAIVDWLVEKWNQFVDWLGGIWQKVYDWGANLVQGIWDGIKSGWSSMTEWFGRQIDALLAPIKDALIWMGILDDESAKGTAATFNRGAVNNQYMVQPIAADTTGMGNAFAYQQAQQANNRPHIIDKTMTKTEKIQTNVYLDGDKIYENVDNRSNINNGRS